ncbi:MAG: hypothetical protein PBV01_10345 [Brucella anthropi]
MTVINGEGPFIDMSSASDRTHVGMETLGWKMVEGPLSPKEPLLPRNGDIALVSRKVAESIIGGRVSPISRQHLERLLRLVDHYANEFDDAYSLMLDIYHDQDLRVSEGCIDRLVAKICG